MLQMEDSIAKAQSTGTSGTTQSVSGTALPANNVRAMKSTKENNQSASFASCGILETEVHSAPSSNVFPAANAGSKSDLEHSHAAQMFMGKRIPQNTDRANKNSLLAFARFFTERPGFVEEEFVNETFLKNYHFETPERRVKWQLSVTRREVFKADTGTHLPHGHSNWTEKQLKNVRFYLIEFVNYRSVKGGEPVKPQTMKYYITGLQRAFADEWGYELKLLAGPVFACPKEGLMPVLNNKFSSQQADGARTESHNHLSIDDIRKLFQSELCSRNTPNGFLTRLVLGLGIKSALRTSALVFLLMKQITEVDVNGEKCFAFMDNLAARQGLRKLRKAVGPPSIKRFPNVTFVTRQNWTV